MYDYIPTTQEQAEIALDTFAYSWEQLPDWAKVAITTSAVMWRVWRGEQGLRATVALSAAHKVETDLTPEQVQALTVVLSRMPADWRGGDSSTGRTRTYKRIPKPQWANEAHPFTIA